MSLADKQFIKMCEAILSNGESSEGQIVRPKWEDGVSAHTISLSNWVSTYDLSKEFPALTLRETNLKAAMDEILWIWQKKSNNVKDLNSHIWDAWAEPQTSRDIVFISPRIKEKPKRDLPDIRVSEIISDTLQKRSSKNYGDYYILENINENRRKIQFCKTGYTTIVSQAAVSTGEVKDHYVRSVAGLGYYGDYKADDIIQYFEKYHSRWVNTWENMIRRCNGIYSGGGDWYDNIFVDEEFHSCEQFLRWVMKNNRYNKNYLGILQIDKDYYVSNCYSPDACVLLTPKENTSLTVREWYKLHGRVFYSRTDLAQYFKQDLHMDGIYKPNGQYNDYAMRKYINAFLVAGDMEIIYPRNPSCDGLVPRFVLDVDYTIKRAYGYQLGVKHKFPQGEMDQVDDILWQLKNTPASRRMITSIYNHADLHEMGLSPCVWSTQWTVKHGRLNLLLIQRSQDTLVANNWNVAQYAILQMMFAQVSGLKSGILTHVIGDAHIYDRHIPFIEDLIGRDQYDAPLVSLNPAVDDFYAFTVDDLIVENYQFGPQIKKIPVAV